MPESGGLVRESFGQLWHTLKDLRGYPVTLTFLLAYLFYNDGIQTVIYAASVYGEKELHFEKSTVLSAFLLVQFVGIGGALLFGRIAERRGTRGTILVGLVIWIVVVIGGYFTPEKNFGAVPRPRGQHRPGPGRHPGAVPVVLQPADPPRPRGGVLLALPGLRARHELVRHPDLRPGAPVDRLLPAGPAGADPAVRPRAGAAVAGQHRARASAEAGNDAPAP